MKDNEGDLPFSLVPFALRLILTPHSSGMVKFLCDFWVLGNRPKDDFFE